MQWRNNSSRRRSVRRVYFNTMGAMVSTAIDVKVLYFTYVYALQPRKGPEIKNVPGPRDC